LEGEKLRTLWAKLDEVQQAAVSETVYDIDDFFMKIDFKPSMDGDQNWGSKIVWI